MPLYLLMLSKMISCLYEYAYNNTQYRHIRLVGTARTENIRAVPTALFLQMTRKKIIRSVTTVRPGNLSLCMHKYLCIASPRML